MAIWADIPFYIKVEIAILAINNCDGIDWTLADGKKENVNKPKKPAWSRYRFKSTRITQPIIKQREIVLHVPKHNNIISKIRFVAPRPSASEHRVTSFAEYMTRQIFQRSVKYCKFYAMRAEVANAEDISAEEIEAEPDDVTMISGKSIKETEMERVRVAMQSRILYWYKSDAKKAVFEETAGKIFLCTKRKVRLEKLHITVFFHAVKTLEARKIASLNKEMHDVVIAACDITMRNETPKEMSEVRTNPRLENNARALWRSRNEECLFLCGMAQLRKSLSTMACKLGGQCTCENEGKRAHDKWTGVLDAMKREV